MESLILATGLIYFTGHLLTHFFERSKIPDVLMLILFGIIIGPLTGIMTVDKSGKIQNISFRMSSKNDRIGRYGLKLCISEE